MIINAMMFLNENDVLEIKINNHWDFVDKFIVVESSQTHTGYYKGYNFDAKRFAKYSDKLIYVQIDSIDDIIRSNPSAICKYLLNIHRSNSYENTDDWMRDNAHAHVIYDVLEDQNVSDDDLVIIDCCDEIISNSAVQSAIKLFTGEKFDTISSVYKTKLNIPELKEYVDPIFGFKMQNYFLKLNLQSYDSPTIVGSLITTMRNIKKISFCTMRYLGIQTHPPIDGGYHFAFLDNKDGELVFQKFKSWAHSRDSHTNFHDSIHTKQDAINRLLSSCPNGIRIVPISNETHPPYLVDNINKYKHVIYEESSNDN